MCYVFCILRFAFAFAFADAACCVPTGMTDFCFTFFNPCNDFSISKNQNIEKTQKSQKWFPSRGKKNPSRGSKKNFVREIFNILPNFVKKITLQDNAHAEHTKTNKVATGLAATLFIIYRNNREISPPCPTESSSSALQSMPQEYRDRRWLLRLPDTGSHSPEQGLHHRR